MRRIDRGRVNRPAALDRTLLALGVLIAAEAPAAAYIDPGSGALIWQAIVAGAFGAVFYFRRFLARLTFRRRDDKPGAGRDPE